MISDPESHQARDEVATASNNRAPTKDQIAYRLAEISGVPLSDSDGWPRPIGQLADYVLALLAKQRAEFDRLAAASAEVERFAAHVTLENGFVACQNCGEQESNDDMDFMPELRAALVGLRAALPAPGAAHAP